MPKLKNKSARSCDKKQLNKIINVNTREDVMAKGRKEIKQELEQKKREGDLSSKKALELAKLAEKTKATLESMQGEATEEAAKGMESAAAAFQQTIETKAVQAEQQSEKIDTALEQTQQKFEEAKKSDQVDINKLKSLESEAKRVNVGVEGVVQAEKAKMEEMQFLTSESQGVEKAQQEMQKKITEAKQKRQGAKFSYKSRNTLG